MKLQQMQISNNRKMVMTYEFFQMGVGVIIQNGVFIQGV